MQEQHGVSFFVKDERSVTVSDGSALYLLVGTEKKYQVSL